MGKGKGAPEQWVAVVKSGRILFEMEGVERGGGAERAMEPRRRQAAHPQPGSPRGSVSRRRHDVDVRNCASSACRTSSSSANASWPRSCSGLRLQKSMGQSGGGQQAASDPRSDRRPGQDAPAGARAGRGARRGSESRKRPTDEAKEAADGELRQKSRASWSATGWTRASIVAVERRVRHGLYRQDPAAGHVEVHGARSRRTSARRSGDRRRHRGDPAPEQAASGSSSRGLSIVPRRFDRTLHGPGSGASPVRRGATKARVRRRQPSEQRRPGGMHRRSNAAGWFDDPDPVCTRRRGQLRGPEDRGHQPGRRRRPVASRSWATS